MKAPNNPEQIEAVTRLAEGVFDSKEAAARWMTTPNQALSGTTPITYCESEIGARQVRRVLFTI